MADRQPVPDDSDAPDADAASRPTAGAPRWVKVFGLVLAVILLLFVVLQVVGGGHGPGRHASSSDANTAPWAIAADHAPSRTEQPPSQARHR